MAVSNLPSLLEQCTGLPLTTTYKTRSTFPIDGGDVIPIYCRPGLLKRGDGFITCLRDTEYTYMGEEEPSCSYVGWWQDGVHCTQVFNARCKL